MKVNETIANPSPELGLPPGSYVAIWTGANGMPLQVSYTLDACTTAGKLLIPIPHVALKLTQIRRKL